MKNIHLTLIFITAVILTGCASTQSNTAVEQSVVTIAAQDATVLVLQKNPQYRPAFVAGSALLGTIATGTNELTPSMVNTALQASGQTNQVVNMVILNGISVLDAYAQSQGTNITAQSATVQTGASWIQAGINQGLAVSP